MPGTTKALNRSLEFVNSVVSSSVNGVLDRMACSALNASEQAYQTAVAQAASKDEEIGRLQASLAEANTDRERLRSRVQTLSNTEAELHVLRVEARRALSALAHAQESDRTQQAAVLAAAEAETARLHAALTASTAEREQLASLLHMSRFDYERLASLSASSESAAGSAGIRGCSSCKASLQKLRRREQGKWTS